MQSPIHLVRDDVSFYSHRQENVADGRVGGLRIKNLSDFPFFFFMFLVSFVLSFFFFCFVLAGCGRALATPDGERATDLNRAAAVI